MYEDRNTYPSSVFKNEEFFSSVKQITAYKTGILNCTLIGEIELNLSESLQIILNAEPEIENQSASCSLPMSALPRLY